MLQKHLLEILTANAWLRSELVHSMVIVFLNKDEIRLLFSEFKQSKKYILRKVQKENAHLPGCYKQQWCALVLALHCFSGPQGYLWYVLEDDRKKRAHSIASYREDDQTAVHEQNQQVKRGWRERRKTKPEEKGEERGKRETERKRNLICPLFCYN